MPRPIDRELLVPEDGKLMNVDVVKPKVKETEQGSSGWGLWFGVLLFFICPAIFYLIKYGAMRLIYGCEQPMLNGTMAPLLNSSLGGHRF